MKRILMIGNGFDIAHGLYTKYINFYEFCMVFHNKDVEDIDESFRERIYHEFIECGFKKSAVNVILKENIISDELLRKMIDICKNNYWLNCIQKRQSLKDPHWCDIEGIIAQEIAKIVYISKHYKNKHMRSIRGKEENDEIVNMFIYIGSHSKKASLRLAIGEIKEKLLLDLNELTWLLGCYLSKFLNHTKTRYEFFKSLNIDYVINFNYTDTYSKLYNKNIPTHFIHGNVQKNIDEQFQMVFGIGDKINDAEDNYEFIEFQKYYQRIIYKTGNEYIEWLSHKEEIIEIIIFGHSINEVDGDIIKKISLRYKTRIYIYYYDQEALNSIVANLTKILGKDIMIDYTNINKIQFRENNLKDEFIVKDKQKAEQISSMTIK